MQREILVKVGQSKPVILTDAVIEDEWILATGQGNRMNDVVVNRWK